jgi:DNA (cytosine-5)-methyltransferase 1
MKADDFLSLLEEWALLCDKYVHGENAHAAPPMEDLEEQGPLEKDELVVDKLSAISYGGADRESCIYFKVLYCRNTIISSSVGTFVVQIVVITIFEQVQWSGFDREEDTWEPIENLRFVSTLAYSYSIIMFIFIAIIGKYLYIVQHSDSYVLFSGCPLKIMEFVQDGHMRKILPLPVSARLSFFLILNLNIRFDDYVCFFCYIFKG